MKEFTVVIHLDETGGFWTEVPALPGCGSQGESIEEAIEMNRDAIEGMMETLAAHGRAIPEERNMVVKIQVGD